MENLDIDQLKKDLDEILELSSQQVNEVAKTTKNDDDASGAQAATEIPEDTQHFLKVHSLNDEESVQAQNRQSTDSEKRRASSVTFNEEPEIHVKSQITIQSETLGVINGRPEINELGLVNEFTQTGVSLMYAAVESPKEEALRHRTSSTLSQADQNAVIHDERVTTNAGSEPPRQVDPCQAYRDQKYQPAYEGESPELDDIVSLQFQHNPQNPVAFSMLPDDNFLRPESDMHAEKMLFGPQNDDSIGFHDSPKVAARGEKDQPNENRCLTPPAARQCRCATYQQEQLQQPIQQQLGECRFNYPAYQENHQAAYLGREERVEPYYRDPEVLERTAVEQLMHQRPIYGRAGMLDAYQQPMDFPGRGNFTTQGMYDEIPELGTRDEPLVRKDEYKQSVMEHRLEMSGTAIRGVHQQQTGYLEREHFTALPARVEPIVEMYDCKRSVMDQRSNRVGPGIPEAYQQEMRYPAQENFAVSSRNREPEGALVAPYAVTEHSNRSVMAEKLLQAETVKQKAYEEQSGYQDVENLKTQEMNEETQSLPARVEPLVEMDECKRSVINASPLQDEAKVRPSRSYEQRNLSIISTNSGTTFHKDFEEVSFVHEPSLEALAESAHDPGAGNIDFDYYPPLDQRSPIRINVGSKVYIGDEIQEVPEVQPGVVVGTIPPEFHTKKSFKVVMNEEPVKEELPANVDVKGKTSLEDMRTLTEALTARREELPTLAKEEVLSVNKLKQKSKVSFAALGCSGPCVPYKGYKEYVSADQEERNCTCAGVDVKPENVEATQSTPTESSKRTLGSTSSDRDNDNIVTMRVDGVTTFFQDDDPLPITPFGSSSNLYKKRSKSKMSATNLSSNVDSVPLPDTAFGSSLELSERKSKTSIIELPAGVALDEPIDFSLNNAILTRDQENINLMASAGLLAKSWANQDQMKPTISEVNQKIFEDPPRQCREPCRLEVPMLIKSRDATFEFVEQADALSYRPHAANEPVFQDHPQQAHNVYHSPQSLQNNYLADLNNSTLKRGVAMENLSQIKEEAVCSPVRRNCQCEKRLQAAMEPENPQKMSYKFAPVPSGVSVMKFIDRKLMESPVGHPYGLEPQSGNYERIGSQQPVRYEHDIPVQVAPQNDYYWNQSGQQRNYVTAPTQNFPCSTSMTAVCSFTQISQAGGQNACYYQPDGAGRSRSAVEDDDGYMNLPRQGVSHVESAAWVDENEIFSVAQQPSLHYRTPLGLGYRNNTGYNDHMGRHDHLQATKYANDAYQPNDLPPARVKPESTMRKCKCAFKRLSKIFRKD